MPIFPTGYDEKVSPENADAMLLGDSSNSNEIVYSSVANFIETVKDDIGISTAVPGWTPLLVAPTLTSTNGNRSFDVSFANVDYTDRLSKGMRLKIPRTGSTPTQSADFNGTTQYASKTSPAGITFTDDFTIEGHIWMDSYPSGTSYLLSRYIVANNTGFGLEFGSNGQIKIFGRATASTVDQYVSNASVPLRKGVHIAASLDISGTSGKIYLDGVEIPGTYTNGTTGSITQGGDLQIGALGGTSFFDGRISDVRLWSTVRTEAQIRDNMNQQLTGSETNLVGYWKLDGDFNDSTVNANNLTPAGGVTATFDANPFNENAFVIISSDPVFSTDTTMTVQAANGYPIPNATLGTASYSSMKVPYEFPSSPSLWSFDYELSGYSQTLNTNLQQTGLEVNLPAGEWELNRRNILTMVSSSTVFVSYTTSLSTSTSSVTNPETELTFTVDVVSGTQGWRSDVSRFNRISTTSLTKYYQLSQLNTTASVSSADVTNTEMIVDFALL